MVMKEPNSQQQQSQQTVVSVDKLQAMAWQNFWCIYCLLKFWTKASITL